ncbi:response regulator transcription factor [soil metagenome]
MTDQTILIADDEEMIVDALSYQLQKVGYRVLTAYDGEEAVRQTFDHTPDLILLDVMMPKMQGWEVCHAIRQKSTVPILMLTARGEEMSRIRGLEMGADDYIVKPFSFWELLARIHANLRRVAYDRQHTPEGASSDITTLGALSIDRKRHMVSQHDEVVALSQREYDLLIALLDADGAVIKRGELLDQVWGEAWIGDPRTLDVHIRWLREKLEADPANPQLILTVRGVGYRMISLDELKKHDA